MYPFYTQYMPYLYPHLYLVYTWFEPIIHLFIPDLYPIPTLILQYTMSSTRHTASLNLLGANFLPDIYRVHTLYKSFGKLKVYHICSRDISSLNLLCIISLLDIYPMFIVLYIYIKYTL